MVDLPAFRVALDLNLDPYLCLPWHLPSLVLSQYLRDLHQLLVVSTSPWVVVMQDLEVPLK
jgi:hypothetical protein